MRRGVTLILLVVAVCVSAILVVALYQLQEQHLIKKQEVRVIAPDQFIPVGHVLKREDLKFVSISKRNESKEMSRNLHSLVGQVAIVALGKDEPIRTWKLADNPIVPKEEEATFQIPKSYLYSISNEIRSGDHVQVFVSSMKGSSELLFPQPVVVASVKTSNNQEVEDKIEANLPNQFRSNREALARNRRNANGLIDYVNLNLTEAQWLAIDRLCKSGSARIALAFTNDNFQAKGGL